jgi:hypothetical protein
VHRRREVVGALVGGFLLVADGVLLVAKLEIAVGDEA